jgi:hypothetical protein
VTDSNPNEQLHRAIGVTPTERYLKRLCDRTFLSLWSYSGIYRDQGNARGGHGKEVCDTLVVFQNHVIIFSDKDCAFPNTGDLQVDWSRWFRRAVLKSAEQIYGAERWIRDFPDRLFLDPSCTQPFPYPLPDPGEAKFHRVVVAHNASDRCRAELGGSGSLMIHTDIVGTQHILTPDHDCLPFAVGHIDPDKGFVHVLDDTALEIVMSALDTISDFVNYLMKKERFLTGDTIVLVPGEEDLLALYLGELNEKGEHDFVFPVDSTEDFDMLMLDEEGAWEDFAQSPKRQRQLAANRISYLWDGLIETTTHHVVQHTQYHTVDPSIAYNEKLLRIPAREPRLKRRMLSEALYDLVQRTPRGQRGLRVILPTEPGDTSYVFVALAQPDFAQSYEEYRRVRLELLYACVMVAKLVLGDLVDIVGIATEAQRAAGGSEDLIYLDARHWTERDEEKARELQKKLDILIEPSLYHARYYEYPDAPTAMQCIDPRHYRRAPRGSDRNRPCPCGSGKKHKKCCGRPWRLPNN